MENLSLSQGSRNNVHRCKITFVQQVDVAGVIPKWIVNKKIPEQLQAVQDAIDEVRQDDRIDAAVREELSDFIKEHWMEEVYSEEEEALLQRVRQKFEGSLEESKWTQLKSPDIFLTMESTYEEGGSTVGVGRAVTIIDAPVEVCAAWEVARTARETMKAHLVYDFGVIAPREWLTKAV
ncbi:hypothetical protein TrVE_jg7700 [Triparma verrucosa]|uniref:Uncharacterized protein n=1 Tax=Triparma verrucosa TaxID=1606542 RepID=A0A9W7CKL9_9STRA|nr:hypothetical protein TrVE_jg7700 [Triparma verrucosa]